MYMARNNKKPVPMKTKSIIGVFSLLGVFVVGLGMLAVTQRASQQETDNQTKAAYFQCQEYQLTQMYYRGNQGWVRNVPIAGGRELWNQGEQFRMFMDLNANPNALPGTGDLQAINYRIDDVKGDLQELIIRGGTRYIKWVPTAGKPGTVDWAKEAATSWETKDQGFQGLTAYGDFYMIPSSSNANSFYSATRYINGKGQMTTSKGAFRNDDYKTVIDLNTNPSAIPGSGPVQAIGDYVSQDNTVLNQVWYRGNIGYMRQVPIRDYKPDYSSATPIQAVVDLNKTPNALPGSGDMQATANFISCVE